MSNSLLLLVVVVATPPTIICMHSYRVEYSHQNLSITLAISHCMDTLHDNKMVWYHHIIIVIG